MAADPNDSEDLGKTPGNGTFRPNTDALLRLVVGEAFHGTPLAAVRELLQNAFDAVREKIARQRLLLPPHKNPGDPKWETHFGEIEQVTLSLVERKSGRYLICEDTGTGLTQEIFTKQLLSPGQGPGQSQKELENQCRALGFTLGCNLRRGIGCLSYFMLAEEVTIESIRDPLCGDDHPGTLRLRATGLGDFDKLPSLPMEIPENSGTSVTWKLSGKTTTPGLPTFEEQLSDYLTKTVVRVPCYLFVIFENELPARPSSVSV